MQHQTREGEMLLYLAELLKQIDPSFAALQYITLRTLLATTIALVAGIMLGAPFIRYLHNLRVKQIIRTDGPKSHYDKVGTPTMGGLLILFSLLIATLLCADLSNLYVWVAIITTTLFAAIGYWDDYLKMSKKNTKGLLPRYKMLLMSIAAITVLTWLYIHLPAQSPELSFFVPVFKDWSIYLGPMYIVFGYFVIVGSSNAVNMTDGLDGLAIVPTVMVAAVLGVFAYTSGNVLLADYLHLSYLRGAGEITIVCGALAGAGLSFLWFNAHPAQIFMGDVGSLSLGAAIGVISFMLRQELILFFAGGIFVIEALSVILQVGCYKLYRKRIFPMAPLHHSFETKGMPETKVVTRFWIISLLLALISLATLKIR